MSKPRALTIAELERINHVTGNNARNFIHEMSKLATMAADGNAEQRRAACRCSACEYLRRYQLAGQAFTNWKCGMCSEDQIPHPNTATPRLCERCARAYGLCASCGGDIEMHHRGRRSRRALRQPKEKR